MAKKRIVLVDDAPVIRLMLRSVLENDDYDIVGEGGSGEEAVALFKELRPDLMTLDIVMPGKDGIQALQEILLMDPNAKVVMLTAIDQREYLMKAIRLGAMDYIVKPFEDDRVTAAVANALDC